MIFTILGWLATGIIPVYMSILGFFMCMNNLGTYNIGGVPNGTWGKIGTILYLFLVIGIWYLYFISAPFEVSVKM